MRDYLEIDPGFVHFPDPLLTKVLHSLEKWIGRARLVMQGIQHIVPIPIEIVLFQRDDHDFSCVPTLFEIKEGRAPSSPTCSRDLLRLDGGGVEFNLEVGQCIADRIFDTNGRSNSASLSDTFETERI